jgi:hypothetical protein
MKQANVPRGHHPRVADRHPQTLDFASCLQLLVTLHVRGIDATDVLCYAEALEDQAKN